ncbi:MAG: hypothetical protein NTZ39_05425 [Methanoregula sp.]|nr:hypothetical protein [Methanoregula sp.]
MDSKLSNRVPVIIVLVIGIILLVDIINVFVIGGPSFFSLIFKPGNAASTSGTSPAMVFPGISPGNNASAGSPASQAIFVPTTAIPVPTVKYVTVVTPIREETNNQSSLRIQSTSQPTQDQNDYALIYSQDLSFLSGQNMTAVAFDVKEPPLIINYNVFPVMVTDAMAFTNNSPSNKGREEIINNTRPSDFSRFTVTVYDRKSGGKIAQDGYGGLYGITPQKTFVVREAGSYIIQFEGESTEVHVDMLLKREGNIV